MCDAIPVKRFRLRSKSSSSAKRPRLSGIAPVKRFPCRFKRRRFGK